MPVTLEYQFMKGQHTMHHKPGIFNGIWSDKTIDTTYNRHVKGSTGIIGLTMTPEDLKTWEMSIHAINTLMADINTVNNDEVPSQTHHKE